MARSEGTRYPRGGSALWLGPDAGPVLLRAEFFGAASPGVAATITGVQATASAGLLSVSGAVARAITGVQATASAGSLVAVTGHNQTIVGVQAAAGAGSLSPSGGVLVTASGAQASAQAGVLVAGGVAPPGPSPTPSGGGGRTPARRRIELPDLVMPEPPAPPIRIPARADIPPVVATAMAGPVRAFGATAAVAGVTGAASKSVCHSLAVKASVSVAMPSAAANRAPAVVCLGSVGGRSSCAEVKAVGLGISDEEILALLVAA